MEDLYFTTIDIAVIVCSLQLGIRDENKMIDAIWNGEKELIAPECRNSKRKFFLDVYYWGQYFYQKPTIDREFPAIQKDLELIGSGSKSHLYTSDFSDIDLFFKSIRLRILYGGGNDYVRIKLRTLLKHYGYKRRSIQLVERFRRCMLFYGLETFLRGGVSCSVDTVSLDDMIVFRIKK